MVVSIFSVLDKDNREKFFEESFLLANVNPNVVFGMPFLIINNADMDFQVWDLQWGFYTTEDKFLTIGQVKLIEKNEFITTTLDSEHKAFVVHVNALSVDFGDEMYLLKRA